MQMRSALLAAILFAGGLATAAVAQQQAPAQGAQQAPGTMPGMVRAEKVTAEATVEAVDPQARTVTLRGPRGNMVTVQVGPEVKNFDQIKAGDTVRAQYLQATAIFVRKPGEAPSGAPGASGARTVAVAPPGEMPGGMVANTVERTATVQDIDYNTRKVTLAGQQGRTIELNVDPSVEGLDQVKKGDQVVVRHTEAIALDVEK